MVRRTGSLLDNVRAGSLAQGAYFATLLLPAAYVFQAQLGEKTVAAAGASFAFAALLLLLPLTVLRARVYVCLLLPFFLLTPFELIHVIEYDGYTTLSALASSLESSFHETTEFVWTYRHYFYAFGPLYLLAAAVLVRGDAHMGTGSKGVLAGSFLLLCAAFSIKTYRDAPHEGWAGQAELYGRLLDQNYPYAYVQKLYAYVDQRNALLAALDRKKDFSFGARQKSGAEGPEHVVIVIGETSRAHNWQLGGYVRETNPLLARRSDFIYFTRAVTAATHTRESVQISLTRATAENLAPIYEEKSLIQAFREAGFGTYWLSNQNKLGLIDTPITAIAAETHEVKFTNQDYRTNPAHDAILVPMLEAALAGTQSKKLIVVHTLGSHEVYRMRYPPAFEVFKPASRGDDYNFKSDGIRERLLNSYDNSILYTDFVLNELIDRLQAIGGRSLLLYFSDHGENVLDDEQMRFGHGGVIPTDYVARIPLLVWASGEYRRHNEQIWQALSANAHKPVSLNGMFDAVLDLAHIEIDDHTPAASFARAGFEGARQIILNTNYEPIDYIDDVAPATSVDIPAETPALQERPDTERSQGRFRTIRGPSHRVRDRGSRRQTAINA